jgi:hypothetical protein
MSPLFPLPLTPFEYYYWCDNRPEYPTAFPVEMTFSGRLEREPFQRALAMVVARHPLLTARVRQEGLARPLWVDGSDQMPPIDWIDDDTPVTHPHGEYIDLRREPGLRVWVRRAVRHTRVLLEFHHVCCDGLGAMRLVDELLTAYQACVAGRDPTTVLRPLEPARLRTRGNYVAEGVAPPSWRDLWIGIRGWLKLLSQSPAPMATLADSVASPGPFLGFVTHTWDAATTRRLREVASKLGGTFNDLLLRDLFQSLCRWNARKPGSDNPWLRINMPTTLRTREDAAMPLANALGFTFLTRRAADCKDGTALFDSIRHETETIRQFRSGLYFLGGLDFVGRVPGAMPWILRRRRSFATIVLSNLGTVLRRSSLPRRDGHLVCGEAVLERIVGVPPIRPLTRAAIAVIGYGGETTVSLRCDPHCFTLAQAQEFLGEYVAQIASTGQTP